MAVKTDLDDVNDKKVVLSKVDNNPKQCLQVAQLDKQIDCIKTDIKTIDEPSPSQDLVRSIKSSTVRGKVSVVGSENLIIGNNTYFKGPVRIKKLRQKIVESKNSSVKNENKNAKNISDSHEKEVKTSHNIFTILKVDINTLGLVFIVTLTVVLALLLSRTGHHQGATSSSAEGDRSITSFTSVLGLFYENLNAILIAIVFTPLLLLLTANVLLRFRFTIANKKNQDIDELDEVHDSFMRTIRKVKTAVVTPENLRLVSRTVWHAEPIVIELEKMRQPVPWAIISHTATGGCNTQSECVRHVRVIQSYHKDSKDWDDIGYNFLVGGDGAAYCGRGWDYIGAHTLGYNRHSIGISFIGTFNHYPPPKRQLEACKKLLQRGVALGKLAKDYKLFAHRQLWATHSPGDELFKIIKEWPHFVKEFNNISELLPDY